MADVFQIGKTSAVVMTLSGVLKDILLVMASMLIFHDPVTGTQYFGYAIALGGLVYYKLGGEKLQQAVVEARLSFGGIRQNHPLRARAAVVVVVLAALSLIVLALWPAVPEEYRKALHG